MLSLALGGTIVWNALFAQPAGRRLASGTIELALPKGRSGGPQLAMEARPKGTGAVSKSLLVSLQRELAAMSRYAGPLDGRFSNETRAALTAYRRSSGLDQRASVQDVLDHIRYAKTLRKVALAATATTGSTKSDDKTIRMVQTALAELGYSPGPIDGHVGEATRQAIMEFESERQLQVTGDVSPALLEELRKTSPARRVS